MSTNPPDLINDIMAHQQGSEHGIRLDDQSMVALGMLEADALAKASNAPVIAARRVAVLACDGVDESQVAAVQQSLEVAGARVHIVSNRSGFVQGSDGGKLKVDHHWLDMPSVMFDAVYIPGGADSLASLTADPDAVHFVQEAYEHGKALAATSDGVEVLKVIGVAMPDDAVALSCQGIVTDLHETRLDKLSDSFIEAIVKDRHWRRIEEDVSSLH